MPSDPQNRDLDEELRAFLDQLYDDFRLLVAQRDSSSGREGDPTRWALERIVLVAMTAAYRDVELAEFVHRRFSRLIQRDE